MRTIASEHCFYLRHVPRCCIVFSELCCVVLCATLASYTRMPGPGEWHALVHCDLWLASLNEWRGDNDVDLSTTSSYAPFGLLGCGGVKTASLKGKFTYHKLDNSLNNYIIQSANNCKWALLLLATRSTLLYSISELCCVVLCATHVRTVYEHWPLTIR